jgi:hypothetical protein|tara:strand:+ start:6391 stop:8499 length:2109 start_codon:yes stop_codon:yes gene_type:complete
MPDKDKDLKAKNSSKLKGKINPRTKKPYTSSEIAEITERQSKMKDNKEFKYIKYYFINSGLEIKEEGNDFYIEGFVSTPEFDGEGDRFLDQQMIVDQLNNNPEAKIGSLHHDRSGSALTMTEEARLVDGKSWMRVKLNSQHPQFKSTIEEVKNGAINGFSIENKPLLWDKNDTWNEETQRGRDITETHIMGYGLASRPINPGAEITNSYFKEFKEGENNNSKVGSNSIAGKVNKMAKEDIQRKEEAVEETVEDKVDDAPETPTEETEEDKEFKEFKAFKAKNAKAAELKETAKAVKELIENKEGNVAPVINPGMQFDTNTECKESKAYNDAMSLETKEGLSSSNIVDMQWKEANALVNKYPGIAYRSGIMGSREYKESLQQVEYKATLTKTTSEASQYYQAVAELNDIYDPIIYSTMNDEVTTVNLIENINMSGRQMIQFRNLTAGLTAGGYNEGELTSDLSTSITTIKKNEQDFANYAVRYAMTGQIMASSMGGGIGDLFGMYTKRAAVDLAKKINEDFISGAAGTYNGSDDRYILGALHICASTGTIYGRARASNTYLNGTTTPAGSTDLTLAHIRTAKRTVVKAGANLNNLFISTSYFQADRLRNIMQNLQRMVPTSSRVGFEGRIEVDGIPVFEDQNCADANLFMFDRESLKRGTQVAPTLTEMGITGDAREAFIKTYTNFFCRAHGRQYAYTGFTTS